MFVKPCSAALRLGLALLVASLAGGLVLVFFLASVPVPARAAVPAPPADSLAIRSSNGVTTYVYLPLVSRFDPCAPIPGESYSVLAVILPPTDRPAEVHADLNLSLRGYELTSGHLGLVDGGGTDPDAPQLPGLFADNRTPVFSNVYRARDWDWDCNCRGGLITYPNVTVAGFEVAPGETIHVPGSGYDIGGYGVLVLYASAERITLKYTREDNVVYGYTIHVENICVEPSLLALYQAWNDAGRDHLPALQAGQAFGRARSSEIRVAIRDTGTFMDPRIRGDWWPGR